MTRALGAPVVALLRRYSLHVGELEDAVLQCLEALEVWRHGSEDRQGQVARVVESVADLAGETAAHDRRERLIAGARELELEHQRDATALVGAFELLSGVATSLARANSELAADIDAAVRAMAQAVDAWIETEGPELLRSAGSLAEVAGLTTVISDLVGVAALSRRPVDAAGASTVVAGSPAAHRLIKALHQRWLEVAPESLPNATFASSRRTDLLDALDGGAPVPPREGGAERAG